MGSRLMGFTQELFNDNTATDPEAEAKAMGAMAAVYPSIYELYLTVTHDDDSIVGPGCDDQFEFEFALDLLLNGLQRLKDREDTRSTGRSRPRIASRLAGRRRASVQEARYASS